MRLAQTTEELAASAQPKVYLGDFDGELTIRDARALVSQVDTFIKMATTASEGALSFLDILAKQIGITIGEVADEVGVDLETASVHDLGRVTDRLSTMLYGEGRGQVSVRFAA